MLQEIDCMPKKVLPVIFVIDTSGSMEGERISYLNHAMEDALEMLREKNSNNTDFETRIAVLQFGGSVRWVTGDKLIPLEGYCWEGLEASGITNTGNALRELSDKLSRNCLFNDISFFGTVLMPNIIFISDGPPADYWEQDLEYANKNRWFRHSFKQAIGIGDDVPTEVLIKISGDRECLLLVDDPAKIHRCVEEVINRLRIIASIIEPLPVDDPEFELIIVPIPKKVLPVIFVIDTSGSMEGDRISYLNNAMRDALEMLREKNSNNTDFETRIAVLQFGSSVRWVTGDKLIPLEDYCWEDLEASGITNMGKAVRELSGKLSRNCLFKDIECGVLLPNIIFISDGYPTDCWEQDLEYANNNRWFRNSNKQAVGIGDDVSTEVLIKTIGDRKWLLLVDDPARIHRCIEVVTNRLIMVSTTANSFPPDDPEFTPTYEDLDGDDDWGDW